MTTKKTSAPSKGKSPASSSRARRKPFVLLPVLLLAAVGGWYLFEWIAARSTVAAARTEVLREVDEELAKEPVDSSALSRLMARIQKIEDHATAGDLLSAQARIEMERNRPERAFDLFAAVGNGPRASDADRRLLTRILLRRHESGGGDRATAEGWLRDGAARAMAIAERSGSIEDWFIAWQAAVRLDDQESVQRAREQLLAIDAQARESRLAAAAAEFRPETSGDVLYAMRGEFAVVPVELAAMLCMVQLQAGETAAALSEVEALLSRAAGVLGVRVCAAIVFHVCVLNSQDEAGKQRWRPRRNAQIDWLLDNAPSQDARREGWSAMRSQ